MRVLSLFKNCPARDEYFNIIETYKARTVLKGEKHHIVPRSLGGSDNPENILRVPARCHYRLHQLLVDMCKSKEARKKMAAALWRMSNPQTWNHSRPVTTPSSYAKARALWVREMVEDNPMHRPEILALFIGKKRPAQSKVMQSVNDNRWKRSAVKLSCSYCGIKYVAEITDSTKIRTDWCCGKSCYAYHKKVSDCYKPPRCKNAPIPICLVREFQR